MGRSLRYLRSAHGGGEPSRKGRFVTEGCGKAFQPGEMSVHSGGRCEHVCEHGVLFNINGRGCRGVWTNDNSSHLLNTCVSCHMLNIVSLSIFNDSKTLHSSRHCYFHLTEHELRPGKVQ